jgi:cytochrome c-type biogenesis protein
VPLSQRGRSRRFIGLGLLYGAGLTVTLTLWGVVIAAAGGFLGLREIARYLSIVGGVVAYILGLWTLELVRFPLPSGSAQLPAALRGRSEYVGAFFMGLLLGNMGMCCPDPVFLSMIPFIAAKGRVADGATMAAAYGLGRATPLVGLVMLAGTGVNPGPLAARNKERFDRVVGWGLVAVGAFMLYGYSGVPHEVLLAVLLMSAPVVAYHVSHRTPLPRAAGWLAGTIAGTVVGLRLVYALLVNLP